MQMRKRVVPFSVVICLGIIPTAGEDNSTKLSAGDRSTGEAVSHNDAFGQLFAEYRKSVKGVIPRYAG